MNKINTFKSKSAIESNQLKAQSHHYVKVGRPLYRDEAMIRDIQDAAMNNSKALLMLRWNPFICVQGHSY